MLRIEADTEEEARGILTGSWSLTFAAKIRTNCPVTCHWMERDSAVCWSLIGTAHNPEEMSRYFAGLNHQGGGVMFKFTVYAAVMALAILLVVCMVPVVVLEKVISAAIRRLVAVSSLILSEMCHD